MAFCSKCGNQLADNQKFCVKCGAPTGVQSSAPVKSNKDGEVIKCPSCGAAVGALDAVCPECGHEFRNRSAGKTVNDFFQQYSNAAPSEKANIVRAFPVPNTKEDILTFLTMGIGNTKGLTMAERNSYMSNSGGSIFGSIQVNPELQIREQEISAWRAKVRQVLDMGKILFKDSESQALFAGYEKQLAKETKPKLFGVGIFG